MTNTRSAAIKNIGIVATRLSGTDGVSLESAKWERVLRELGYRIFYFGGELDRDPARSMLVKQAHFQANSLRALHAKCFSPGPRPAAVTREITRRKDQLKRQLCIFIRRFKLDLLLPENSLTIPIQIPLGLAITELAAENKIVVLAHHHDFFWERKRFLINNVWDYLNMSFPPHLPNVQHVVINSSANNQLSLRTGISAYEIPNVMDFDRPPGPADRYAADVRQALDIPANELFILQPTRVVKRKGIELAIEFTKRLKRQATLVISHASGDEGYEYQNRVKDYSRLLGVRTIFVSDIIGPRRGRTADDRKIYSLDDVYPHADLVTYPSSIEGFGNAFLESIYYRKPVVVNNYSIFYTDIGPKGFQTIE